MITRRSFLTALCALPVIGKWMPRRIDYGTIELIAAPCPPSQPFTPAVITDRWVVIRPDFRVRIQADDRVPFPTLAQYSGDYDGYLKAFAEWDRKYQA